MSPEYAMDGLFSAKSDVFSFGVLVLEIVCGEKNRGFYHSFSELNLLGHVSIIRLQFIWYSVFFENEKLFINEKLNWQHCRCGGSGKMGRDWKC
jgi:hypothetical protein